MQQEYNEERRRIEERQAAEAKRNLVQKDSKLEYLEREMERALKTMSKEIDSANSKVEEAGQGLAKKLKDLEEGYKRNKETMTERHKQQRAVLEAKLKDEETRLGEKYSRYERSEKDRHNKALADLERKRNKIETLERKLEGESTKNTDYYERELAKEQARHEREVDELKTKHQGEEKEMRLAHTRKRTGLEEAQKEQEKSVDTSHQSSKMKANKACTEDVIKYSRMASNAKEELDKKRKGFGEEKEGVVAEWTKERQRLEQENTQKLLNMEKDYRARMKELESRIKMKRRILMRVFRKMFSNNSSGKAMLKGLRDETGYVGSVLQCLSSCKDLTLYFLSESYKDGYRNLLEFTDADKIKGRKEFDKKVSRKYAKLLSYFWLDGNEEKRARAGRSLERSVASSGGSDHQRMSDAAVFLKKLLEILSAGLNRVTIDIGNALATSYPMVSSKLRAQLQQFRRKLCQDSVVNDLFEGLVHVQAARECKHKSYESRFIQVLDIDLPVTLNDLELIQLIQTSALKVPELHNCEKCGEPRMPCLETRLVVLPSILTINIQRIADDSTINSASVVFPVNGLQLKPYLTVEYVEESEYDLSAVVLLDGDTGKYSAITKHFVDGKWYRHGENLVEIKEADVSEEKNRAHILFYKRRDD